MTLDPRSPTKLSKPVRAKPNDQHTIPYRTTLRLNTAILNLFPFLSKRLPCLPLIAMSTKFRTHLGILGSGFARDSLNHHNSQSSASYTPSADAAIAFLLGISSLYLQHIQCPYSILHSIMPCLRHTESQHHNILPFSCLLRPLISACSSQVSQENRGNDGSRRGNSTIATNLVSQNNYTATNPGFRPQSVPANSGYQRESMDYRPIPTVQSQAWPSRALTGPSKPSNASSRPNISQRPASHSRYQSYQGGRGRSDLGDNGLSGAPVAPDMSYGEGGGEVEGEAEGGGGEAQAEGTSCCDDILSFLDGVGSVVEDLGSKIGSCLKDCCCDSEGNCQCPCPCPLD